MPDVPSGFVAGTAAVKRKKRTASTAQPADDESDCDESDDDLDINAGVPPQILAVAVPVADACAAGSQAYPTKTGVEKRRRVDATAPTAAPVAGRAAMQQPAGMLMAKAGSQHATSSATLMTAGYGMQPGMARSAPVIVSSQGMMPGAQMQQMQMGMMAAQPASYSPMWGYGGGGGGGGSRMMPPGQPDPSGLAQMSGAMGGTLRGTMAPGIQMMAMKHSVNPAQQSGMLAQHSPQQQMGLAAQMGQSAQHTALPVAAQGVATANPRSSMLAAHQNAGVSAHSTHDNAEPVVSNGASQAENEAAAAAAIAEAEAASDIDAGALNGNDELSGQLDERLREQLSLYTQSTRMNAGVSSYDQTITILNSRVVQKSYGSEKRFFCPPPYVKLTGSGWLSKPPPTIQMSIDDNYSRNSPVDVEADGANSYIARAKFLYISDTDKRKTFFLRVKVTTKDGHDLGVFTSTPIKVISKPSKRKFSLSNIDMRIDSGAEISLFNRVRSQSGSTRFLQGSPAGFLTSTSVWGTFTIYRKSADIDRNLNYQQSASADFIHYNMDVYLKCRLSNLMSSTYVIRKVEKNVIIKDESDPVSQLQKVAFYIKGSNRMYLTVPNENVTVQQSTGTEAKEMVPDQSIWTIGSAEMKEYTFCEGLRAVMPGKAPLPINPVPVVKYIKTLGPLIELFGENFSYDLKVWFDDVPAVTIFRCEELLLCKPPDVAKFGEGAHLPMTVQLVLVRSDGVIYRANHKYTYSPSSYDVKGGQPGLPSASTMLNDQHQHQQQQHQHQHHQMMQLQQQQKMQQAQQQQQQQLAMQQQMLMQQAMMRGGQQIQMMPPGIQPGMQQAMSQRQPEADQQQQQQAAQMFAMQQQIQMMQQQQMMQQLQPGPT